MIQQIELQNAAGFIDPPGEAQISLRRGGVTRRDHDERVGGVSVYRLKDFSRVGEGLIDRSLANRGDLD